MADFDRDGDIDFVINNYKAPAAYYVNDATGDNGSITVVVRATRGNSDAVGARVNILRPDKFSRTVTAGHGYAGQNSFEQVIGIGDADEVDLDVYWRVNDDHSWRRTVKRGARAVIVERQREDQLERMRRLNDAALETLHNNAVVYGIVAAAALLAFALIVFWRRRRFDK